MTRSINRLKYVLVGAFALLTAAVWIYQAFWVVPEKHCVAAHNWWDAGSRQCGRVIYIPDITHRPVLPKPPPEAAPLAAARS